MTNSKGFGRRGVPGQWWRVPKISVANPDDEQEALVDADLDTLATALYVRTDDLLNAAPEWAPWRPAVGIAPRITDAELVNAVGDAGLAGAHQRGALVALRPRSSAAFVSLPGSAARL